MTPVLIGQLLGLAFACGLNLYAAVAALGLLARGGVIRELPHGLQGLEGGIVIGSAVALYLIEFVLDKVRHVDSLWDTVHTFVRPPAAALLAMGALWTAPAGLRLAGAAFAFVVALGAHGTKAGLRMALNAGPGGRGHPWISIAEDIAAVAFAVAAVDYPGSALVAGAVVLALMILFGPRLWRAFTLGLRALVGGFRALFRRSAWREGDRVPRHLRRHLRAPPAGTAAPRWTRVGVDGIRGVGAYRTGWLVLSWEGARFVHRTFLGSRAVPLPTPTGLAVENGLWTDRIRITADAGSYLLYLLKDGPPVDTAVNDIRHFSR